MKPMSRCRVRDQRIRRQPPAKLATAAPSSANQGPGTPKPTARLMPTMMPKTARRLVQAALDCCRDRGAHPDGHGRAGFVRTGQRAAVRTGLSLAARLVRWDLSATVGASGHSPIALQILDQGSVRAPVVIPCLTYPRRTRRRDLASPPPPAGRSQEGDEPGAAGAPVFGIKKTVPVEGDREDRAGDCVLDADPDLLLNDGRRCGAGQGRSSTGALVPLGDEWDHPSAPTWRGAA